MAHKKTRRPAAAHRHRTAAPSVAAAPSITDKAVLPLGAMMFAASMGAFAQTPAAQGGTARRTAA